MRYANLRVVVANVVVVVVVFVVDVRGKRKVGSMDVGFAAARRVFSVSKFIRICGHVFEVDERGFSRVSRDLYE